MNALKALQERIKELERENVELKKQDEWKRQVKILSVQLGMVEDEKRRHLELNAVERQEMRRQMEERDKALRDLRDENQGLKKEIEVTRRNLVEI